MRVAYVRHDPFGSLLAGLVQPAVFRPVFRPVRAAQPADGGEATVVPRVDVVDKGDAFAMTFDLPGVGKEDIKVEVEGARVSVSASRQNGAASQTEQIVLRSERRVPRYARALELPAEVDGDRAEASFENGVLSLVLPKRVQVAKISVR